MATIPRPVETKRRMRRASRSLKSVEEAAKRIFRIKLAMLKVKARPPRIQILTECSISPIRPQR